MFTGNVAAPVSPDAVIVPLAPTFTVATANAPIAVGPRDVDNPVIGCCRRQRPISGTGVFDAESNSVLSPVLIGAGSLFAQSKLNCTSVGAIGAVGVMAKIKLCAAPAAMFATAFR
jgi:hypothetical protein